MNKTKIGIFLSLMLVLGFCSSCKEQKSNNKLLLNEVLVNNESNYQDDYGVHSAWIEITGSITRLAAEFQIATCKVGAAV